MSEGSDERAIVAVVGAGTMGAGIAQVALEGGWRVRLHDAAPGELVQNGIAQCFELNNG